jgi:hypothetical protein
MSLSDEIACIACGRPFETGDRYLADESGGFIHRQCCGPEREIFTRNGAPLADGDDIPEGDVW